MSGSNSPQSPQEETHEEEEQVQTETKEQETKETGVQVTPVDLITPSHIHVTKKMQENIANIAKDVHKIQESLEDFTTKMTKTTKALIAVFENSNHDVMTRPAKHGAMLKTAMMALEENDSTIDPETENFSHGTRINASINVYWGNESKRAKDLIDKCLSRMQSPKSKKKQPFVEIDPKCWKKFCNFPDTNVSDNVVSKWKWPQFIKNLVKKLPSPILFQMEPLDSKNYTSKDCDEYNKFLKYAKELRSPFMVAAAFERLHYIYVKTNKPLKRKSSVTAEEDDTTATKKLFSTEAPMEHYYNSRLERTNLLRKKWEYLTRSVGKLVEKKILPPEVILDPAIPFLRKECLEWNLEPALNSDQLNECLKEIDAAQPCRAWYLYELEKHPFYELNVEKKVMEREAQTIKKEHEKQDKKRKFKREHDTAAFQSPRKKIKKEQTKAALSKFSPKNRLTLKEEDDDSDSEPPIRSKSSKRKRQTRKEDYDYSDDSDSEPPIRSKSSKRKRRKSREDYDDSDDSDSESPIPSKFSKKKWRKSREDYDDSDDSDSE